MSAHGFAVFTTIYLAIPLSLGHHFHPHFCVTVEGDITVVSLVRKTLLAMSILGQTTEC